MVIGIPSTKKTKAARDRELLRVADAFWHGHTYKVVDGFAIKLRGRSKGHMIYLS